MENEREYSRKNALGVAIGLGATILVGLAANGIEKLVDNYRRDNEANQVYEMPSLYSKSRVAVPIVPATQPTTQPVRREEIKATSYETDNFSKDSDDVILARMLFGEARNCSKTEKIAVAYTAVNRANDGKKWNGETVKDAVLSKWQYSCFNANDPNRVKLMNPQKYDSRAFDECLDVARKVLAKDYTDPTNGATHYHTLKVNPKWSTSNKMQKIGRLDTEKGQSAHIFYKEN